MFDGACTSTVCSRAFDTTLPNANSIHLEAHRAVIEGTMTLRDGTPWRKISLHKDERK
jgi:hypothetical protein